MLKFLSFYGNFDYKKKSIYIKGDEKIKKLEEVSQAFNLYSPIDGSNLGQQAFKIKEIFYIFKNRFNFITNHSFKECESILKELINPS